jgi:hypothetical protein
MTDHNTFNYLPRVGQSEALLPNSGSSGGGAPAAGINNSYHRDSLGGKNKSNTYVLVNRNATEAKS